MLIFHLISVYLPQMVTLQRRVDFFVPSHQVTEMSSLQPNYKWEADVNVFPDLYECCMHY